jgi:hypothetical protein
MDAWRAILHRAKNFDEQGRYYSSCITRRVGLPAETSQSSATAIPLEGAVVSAARQQVTHSRCAARNV